MRTKCHAKINLFLKVLGRRADGYHEIETLFQEIDLADELVWTPSEDAPQLTVTGADLGDPQQNLVLRAAERFRQSAGLAVGGRFALHKRIPAGSGLGGGSADAAAVLRLMNRYCGEPLGGNDLLALAAEIGSDVPFFLKGGCRLGKGRGERLSPFSLESAARTGFLFFPNCPLSTAEVYRAHQGPPSLPGSGKLGENDLLQSALTVSGEFRKIYEKLAALFRGELFFMTGSGSTLVWLTHEKALDERRKKTLERLAVGTLFFRFREAVRPHPPLV